MSKISFCLKKEEVELLLDHAKRLNLLCMTDKNMATLIEGACCYEHELTSLTYILVKVLEARAKRQANVIQLLEWIYALGDELWLVHQEVDRDFISYLIKVRRSYSGEISLDEKLIRTQEHYSDFDYDTELCR